MTRWQEICTNIPFVAQEILFAWEHGALSPDNVKVRNFLSRILVSCQILITYRG